MNKDVCRKISVHIRESGGVLDREAVRHCLDCEICRGELLGVLAAADSGAAPVSGELDCKVAAGCRNGRKWKRRFQIVRSLTLAGAAGIMVAATVFLWRPESAAKPRLATRQEWDGATLLREISELDIELNQTRKLLVEESGLSI